MEINIQIADNKICKAKVDDHNCIGCHSIFCDDIIPDCFGCKLLDMNLAGGYYDISLIKELIVEEK